MVMQMMISVPNCKFIIEFRGFTNSDLIIFKGLKSCSWGSNSMSVLPLPAANKKIHHFESEMNVNYQEYDVFLLQKLIVYSLMDFYMRIQVLPQWSVSIVVSDTSKVEEGALAIESGDEERVDDDDDEGVDFEEEDEEEIYEADNKDLNCFDNGCVMKMMTSMGYKPRTGLGLNSEGPPTFIVETRVKKSTYGLGYRPTVLDDIIKKEVLREKARATAEGIPFDVPMGPYRSSLNGYFIRAGDTETYWGFNGPRIIPTGWEDE